jgi:hypothetical protein
VAFSTATSIAAIGLYISLYLFRHKLSYPSRIGTPIALRIIYADQFVRGPFHLSKFSYPLLIATVLWIGFISVVFCLPGQLSRHEDAQPCACSVRDRPYLCPGVLDL